MQKRTIKHTQYHIRLGQSQSIIKKFINLQFPLQWRMRLINVFPGFQLAHCSFCSPPRAQRTFNCKQNVGLNYDRTAIKSNKAEEKLQPPQLNFVPGERNVSYISTTYKIDSLRNRRYNLKDILKHFFILNKK